MSRPPPHVAVCVPTLGRPEAVQRLLQNLVAQELAPEAVLIVDASQDEATAQVCARMTSLFGGGVLRHVKAERGLTRQRRTGIELLREEDVFDFVCMLDDDVLLEPDFLASTTGFLESAEGRGYGAVSGYDVVNWGRGFERLERAYVKVGLFDGELRPGRWLRCGRFLQLSRLQPAHGAHESDFLPGGLTVWRMEVFDAFLPPLALSGYALGEDKHLSLRVGSRYKLGVLGRTRVRHERAEGSRLGTFRVGFVQIRHEALMLRDCDPSPTVGRYLRFLLFNLVDVPVRALLFLSRGRWRGFPALLGTAAGWLACLVWPPRRTNDALPRTKPRSLLEAKAFAGRDPTRERRPRS